jgi:hypothetical protein
MRRDIVPNIAASAVSNGIGIVCDEGNRMKRREFITLVGGTAVTWPLAVRAQQPAMPVVGYLSGTSPDDSIQIVADFRRGLAETGYVEGRNLAIEYRWLEGRYDQIPTMLADLVKRRVAVIAIANTQPQPWPRKRQPRQFRSSSASAPIRSR